MEPFGIGVVELREHIPLKQGLRLWLAIFEDLLKMLSESIFH